MDSFLSVTSSVCTFGSSCKRTVKPVINALAHDNLLIIPACAKILLASQPLLCLGEPLSEPVLLDDYDFLLGQHPNRKAPGPDAIPCEL